MYIFDPLERMEVSAEKWAEENIKGNMFKCGCGRICKLNDGQPVNNNPYAPPICSYCFEEWFELQENKNK